MGTGQELGGEALVQLIVEESVTCYEGDRVHRHDWGYGCGVCPACELRAAGYEKFLGANPERSGGSPATASCDAGRPINDL